MGLLHAIVAVAWNLSVVAANVEVKGNLSSNFWIGISIAPIPEVQALSLRKSLADILQELAAEDSLRATFTQFRPDGSCDVEEVRDICLKNSAVLKSWLQVLRQNVVAEGKPGKEEMGEYSPGSFAFKFLALIDPSPTTQETESWCLPHLQNAKSLLQIWGASCEDSLVDQYDNVIEKSHNLQYINLDEILIEPSVLPRISIVELLQPKTLFHENIVLQNGRHHLRKLQAEENASPKNSTDDRVHTDAVEPSTILVFGSIVAGMLLLFLLFYLVNRFWLPEEDDREDNDAARLAT